VLLPDPPLVHCPKCHHTYTARTLHYPVECARCGFRLINWRRRNGIPEIEVPLP
jgi:DNA-directed RNA polymerase subunit RPC12/RpoP